MLRYIETVALKIMMDALLMKQRSCREGVMRR
jgi:hypothetical protein